MKKLLMKITIVILMMLLIVILKVNSNIMIEKLELSAILQR